jgi:hypothetical protein
VSDHQLPVQRAWSPGEAVAGGVLPASGSGESMRRDGDRGAADVVARYAPRGFWKLFDRMRTEPLSAPRRSGGLATVARLRQLGRARGLAMRS